jgi:hypothetical protein
LRGAQEAKEHTWLKYYPWKDLYEKRIEAPFIPKSGDNFDAKYCNTPDKIGLNTKEKYDKYLKDESFKEAFKDFYYYYNEHDDNDKNNSNERKFHNPHLGYNNIRQEQDNYNTRTSNYEKTVSNNPSVEDKFSKIKNMSNGSNNTLLRHYRQSSTSNSTASSGSYVHRKSGSSTNFNY